MPSPSALALRVLGSLLVGGTACGRAQTYVIEWGQRYLDSSVHSIVDCVQVDAGVSHSVLVRADGSAIGWGWNEYGQARIPELPPGLSYRKIVGGDRFSAALRSDGSVSCWGMDGAGRLNPPVLPPGVYYTDLAAGTGHIVALRSDNTVTTWGGGSGPLAQVPTAPSGTLFIGVAATMMDAAALRSDGMIVVWGYTASLQAVPALPPGRRYVQVEGNFGHFIALRDDGSAVAWGSNSRGQCDVPALPAGLSYRRVAAGCWSSAAVRSDGQAILWGGAYPEILDVPELPTGVQYVQVEVGSAHAVARRSDGSVIGWGVRFPVYVPMESVPAIGQRNRHAQVRGNTDHVLVLGSDGKLATWGLDTFGECNLPAGSFQSVSTSPVHSAAVRRDGTAVAWGSDSWGQCQVPQLPPSLRYVSISAGGNIQHQHTAAILSDGSALAWGNNFWGQCDAPALPPGVRYEQIAAGWGLTAAIRSDGVLRIWGGWWPWVVLPTMKCVEITAAATGVMARFRDGSIAVLPYSDPRTGQLPNVPALPAGVTYTGIAMDDVTCAALRSDGTIVVWGNTYYDRADVPRVSPGLGYVGVATTMHTVVGVVGRTSTYVTFASGCAGSRPSTRLVPYQTPHIGQTLHVALDELPVHAAIVMTGWSSTSSAVGPLPLSLATVGMSGCSLAVSPDFLSFVSGADHEAEVSLAVPSDAALVGAVLYQQAVVLDPGAANPLGAVLSDAARFVVGD